MFCNRKAAHVAGYLINKAGGPMYHLLLMKLMYIADRRFLDKKGRAITGDSYCSMNNGPVLSNTYDLMKGNAFDREQGGWSEWISAVDRNYQVRLLRQVDDNCAFDELSRAEMAMLDSVYEEYGHWDRFALCDETHKFQEWQHPDGSSLPIRLKDILKAQGRDDESAEHFVAEIVAQNNIDDLLAKLSGRTN